MVKYKDDPTGRGYSFRLQDSDAQSTFSGASSTLESTIYKQKIDSLFRDKRPAGAMPPESNGEIVEQMKSRLQTKVVLESKKQAPPAIPREKSFDDARNAVQAQIERMFAEASKNEDGPGRHNKFIHVKKNGFTRPDERQEEVRPVSNGFGAPRKNGYTQEFHKNLLEDIKTNYPHEDPVARDAEQRAKKENKNDIEDEEDDERTSAGSGASSVVTDRQEPRSPIHGAEMKYKVDYIGSVALSDKATKLENLQRPLKDMYYRHRCRVKKGMRSLPGTLEILERGVRIQYVRELHKGVQEIFNPFPTIAVWAAVKFVSRREQNDDVTKYAFLPLISDPESQDKYKFYHSLREEESNVLQTPHPPMFACVMRKIGVPKTLECHVFVCSSPEDAIVIAANLYHIFCILVYHSV